MTPLSVAAQKGSADIMALFFKKCTYVYNGACLLKIKSGYVATYCCSFSHRSDEVAEWLRRWTANPMCSARVGSNPILVARLIFIEFYIFLVSVFSWIR